MQQGQIADNQTSGKHTVGFRIFSISTHITNMWVGQSHELSGIGRIGQDFLITGDSSVKHHFTDSVAGRADRHATEKGSVGERKKGGSLGHELLLVGMAKAENTSDRYEERDKAHSPVPFS